MAGRNRGKTTRAANLRRMYAECRYGQLHLHVAFPSGGGFDERTALLCLHGDAGTGRVFSGLAADLGRDRSVYAPDLPGCGESDPPDQAGVAGQATAIGDFLDHLRLRRIDVLGHRGGAAVAVALARARPEQVRRVVLLEATARNDGRTPPAVVPQPVLVVQTGARAGGRAPPAGAASPDATTVVLPASNLVLTGPPSPELARRLHAFLA